MNLRNKEFWIILALCLFFPQFVSAHWAEGFIVDIILLSIGTFTIIFLLIVTVLGIRHLSILHLDLSTFTILYSTLIIICYTFRIFQIISSKFPKINSILNLYYWTYLYEYILVAIWFIWIYLLVFTIITLPLRFGSLTGLISTLIAATLIMPAFLLII